MKSEFLSLCGGNGGRGGDGVSQQTIALHALLTPGYAVKLTRTPYHVRGCVDTLTWLTICVIEIVSISLCNKYPNLNALPVQCCEHETAEKRSFALHCAKNPLMKTDSTEGKVREL